MSKTTEMYYVEDDPNILQAVSEYFEKMHFNVFGFSTIQEVKIALLNHIPDVILIDWNLPDGYGSTLCGWVHLRWPELPIIFLTVRSDVSEVVYGFQNGADDYVVKPFEFEILYSRILAVLRRTNKNEKSLLRCEKITLDKEKKSVYYDGEEIVLGFLEFQLLLLLLENKGKTITRNQLLEKIWDSTGNFVNDNTLTVTMKRLREKLHNPVCLKTVRSFGYRMEETI